MKGKRGQIVSMKSGTGLLYQLFSVTFHILLEVVQKLNSQFSSTNEVEKNTKIT